MCDAIYIGNAKQIFKKIMDRNVSYFLHLIKSGQNSDSFAAHSKPDFDPTTSHTDLRKCMAFKLVKQNNRIGTIFFFMKPNCNLCMDKHLTILKTST